LTFAATLPPTTIYGCPWRSEDTALALDDKYEDIQKLIDTGKEKAFSLITK